MRPPKLKVRTPAHTKQLGWYLEFEFQVKHRDVSDWSCIVPRDAAAAGGVFAQRWSRQSWGWCGCLLEAEPRDVIIRRIDR